MDWEILVGLLVGLLGIAISIFFGLNGLSKRIATKSDILAVRREIAAVRRDILAALYAFSKSSNEKRAITLEDLKEGYSLAEKFLERE